MGPVNQDVAGQCHKVGTWGGDAFRDWNELVRDLDRGWTWCWEEGGLPFVVNQLNTACTPSICDGFVGNVIVFPFI